MKRIVLFTIIPSLLFSFIVAGCGSGGGGGDFSGALFTASFVEKGDPDSGTSPSDVEVVVSLASSTDILNDTIDSATVQINGTDALFFLFFYIISGGPAINSSGDNVTVTCTYGSTTVSATEQMPEQPVITAPAAASSHNAASAITVTWNSVGGSPDNIIVSIDDDADTVGDVGWEATLSGSSTTVDIPANTLKTGLTNVKVKVAAANSTTVFTGSVISGSSHEVRHTDTVLINTN